MAWLIHIETGYCGEDTYIVTDQHPDKSKTLSTELDHYAFDWALQWDHSGEYEPEDEYDEDEDIWNRCGWGVESEATQDEIDEYGLF